MKRHSANAKPKLYWHLRAHQGLRDEHFMTQREMRVYWNEPRGVLYGPLKLASGWFHWHSTRGTGAMGKWLKRKNRKWKKSN